MPYERLRLTAMTTGRWVRGQAGTKGVLQLRFCPGCLWTLEPNLLVGYDSSDDAAVYRLADERR